MRPHPEFVDRQIPTEHQLGEFVLKALTVADQDRDYSAVMESAAEIQAAYPSLTWPDGLTPEAHLIDLAWHQKEFQARRSFAWIIEDCAGEYLGCTYVYPSILGDRTADVAWWWRTGVQADREGFREAFLDWLASSVWPPLNYRLMK